MAASLRAAATRILRPAVLPGQGLRRLVHTQQHSVSPRALDEGYHCASQIQQKKEELFNLMAEADADSATTWLDRRLLKVLCTQVKPRPKDPKWRRIAISKAVTSCTWVAGFLVIYVLSPRPKIVEYDGHLVTAESLPMLQEILHKQHGYQPVATAEGVQKQEEMQKQMG